MLPCSSGVTPGTLLRCLEHQVETEFCPQAVGGLGERRPTAQGQDGEGTECSLPAPSNLEGRSRDAHLRAQLLALCGRWETHEQMNLIHGLEGVSLVSGVRGRERSRTGPGLECGFTSD